MFPPAPLHLVDRLVTALMTLIEAVAPTATARVTPNLPEAAAQTLFFRLGRLVTRLIRISNFGVRTPTKSKPTTQALDPAPSAETVALPSRPPRPKTGASLPRRPGWLLAALPEIAPAVAAEFSALLADPAIAALLDLAPSLHRTLRPLLRGLDLDTAALTPTPPRPPSSGAKPPAPRPRQPRPAAPAREQTAGPRHRVKTRPIEPPALSRHIRYDIVIIWTSLPNST